MSSSERTSLVLATFSVDDVDPSALSFWALPFEQRERSCALLREQRPIDDPAQLARYDAAVAER
jgi:hypothetical protein